MILKNNIKLLSGDASFRKFYRKKNKKKSSIIVFSRKEKKKNLLIYDAINKILIKNKIRAPNLIRQNYNNNFIEIEDFGNLSIYEKLRKKKINKIILFKKIINLLVKIQKIKTRKVETFNNSKYRIPNYTKNKLLAETNLFLEWYIPKVIKKKNQNMLKKKLKLIFKKLLNKVKSKNNTFVHRDFHVSNLMEYKKDIAIIDSQDAVFGNLAYDLASLIDDVRFKTNFKEKNKIFSEYMKFHKNININKFKKDFEILSVLRNLKIIGIFMRLAIRDNKKKYLKLVPYAWEMISYRIKKKKDFKNLMILLKNNFPKLIG